MAAPVKKTLEFFTLQVQGVGYRSESFFHLPYYIFQTFIGETHKLRHVIPQVETRDQLGNSAADSSYKAEIEKIPVENSQYQATAFRDFF